jgi:hypothetical protein
LPNKQSFESRQLDWSDQNYRAWFGWRIIRVRGRSMVPTLNDGDHVLLKR